LTHQPERLQETEATDAGYDDGEQSPHRRHKGGHDGLAGRLWLPRRHPTTWSCALSNHHGGGVTACVCWPGGLVLSTPGEIACVPKSTSSSLSTCYRPVSHIRRASGCSQQCPANTVDDQIHTAEELSPSPRRQQLKLAR